ncbi:MAG: methyl-accepting chemotaxis protein [Huintestinicola sp.]
MGKSNIKKKITSIFLFLNILIIISTVISLINAEILIRNYMNYIDGIHTATVCGASLKEDIEAAEKNILAAVACRDTQKAETYITDAQSKFDEMRLSYEEISGIYTGDSQLLTSINDSLDSAEQIKKQLFSDLRGGDFDMASSTFFTRYAPTLRQIERNIDNLCEDMSVQTEEAVAKAKASRIISAVCLGVICVITIVSCLSCSRYLSNSIRKPVEQSEQAALKLANGDFTAEVDWHSSDELGQLADSIRVMVDGTTRMINDIARCLYEVAGGNLRVEPDAEYIGQYEDIHSAFTDMVRQLTEIIGQINKTSDLVFAEADQVSSNAQTLAQGATEQAAAIDDLAESVSDVAKQIENDADVTERVSIRFSETGKQMEESSRQMQEMVSAMKDIARSSEEISVIIGTIEDIAFQTNILALNAAVEAARAGEAGKGFAVVADEVRNLASKSAEASGDTNALLERSMEAVKRGTEIVNRTAAVLSEACEGSRRAAEAVAGVAVSGREQAAAIEKINRGVEEISKVVQTNTATSEECAASSEQLSSQAAAMKTLVGKFRI